MKEKVLYENPGMQANYIKNVIIIIYYIKAIISHLLNVLKYILI